MSQTVNGVTTNYVLDSNSALTQVLQDGTNTYVYGLDRISQTDGAATEYFLTDGLGSVRQLVDSAGKVTLAKSYQPYGAEISSGGSGHSNFGFTGEMTDPTGLTYLRARYYASDTGRFISRDTWGGNYNRPLSLNRWNYVEGNPINRTDPSGMKPFYPCPNKNNPSCLSKVMELKTEAQSIKNEVTAGTLLPVEGFAQFLDSTMLKFNNDITSTMWAATLVINGFDSSVSRISTQAQNHILPGAAYHIGQNWLPYNDSSCNDIENYYGTNNPWVCTERGDWKVEYWDKTANQAYHGWFFAAVTFFEGQYFGYLGDRVHEGHPYAPIPVDGPPPVSGNTMEDHALSMKMIQLGNLLEPNASTKAFFFQDCPPEIPSIFFPQIQSISIGNWIRSNLKDQTVK